MQSKRSALTYLSEFNNESVMIDLRNPKLEDFKHIEAPVRESATRKTFASFYRVKPGSYVITRTEHKVTKNEDKKVF